MQQIVEVLRHLETNSVNCGNSEDIDNTLANFLLKLRPGDDMFSSPRRWLAKILWFLCLLFPATLSAQEISGSTSFIAEWKEWYYGKEVPLPLYHDIGLTVSPELLNPAVLAPQGGVAPFTIAAWQSVSNNSWDIWAAVESESTLNRITREPTADVNPSVRPGTSQVAYTRISEGNSDIYRADATGNTSTPLITSSAGDNYATYSGDGQWLYFASNRSGNWEIYRANADGGDITPITNDPLPDIMPGVSRDGTMITWVRQVNQSQGVIMRANSDGSEPLALTNPIAFLQHPKFSPDSTRIGFDGDLNGNSWNDVGILNLATGAITTTPNAMGYTNIDYWFSAWSPIDPNEIMYTRAVYVVYQGQLYLQEGRIYNEVLGQSPRQLFNDPLALNAAWERTEIVIPTVSMATLPPYSRVLGFGVSLSGTDTGPAPINRYEAQIRTTGEWLPYSASISPYIPIVQPTGTELEVRVQAVDAAGNRSPFSVAQRTKLYSGELTINATDVLGNSHSNTTFSMDPAPLTTESISEGKIFVRHVSPTTITVRPSAPNFGQLPIATLNAQVDGSFTTYFPGTDNKIANGTFATNLDEWDVGGDIAPLFTTGGHGDATAAWFCSYGICWGQSMNPDSTYRSRATTLDANDTLHVVYVDCCTPRMNYRTYNRVEGWSHRSDAFSAVTPFSVGSMRLHSAADGTLHLTYTDNNSLRYVKRAPNGVWSTPEVIQVYEGGWAGVASDSLLDQNGILHLGFFRFIGISPNAQVHYLYRQRLPNGTWTEEENIAIHGSGAVGEITLLMMPNGIVHAWAREAGHFKRVPGQGWYPLYTNADPASAVYVGSSLHSWIVASDGTIHAIFNRYTQTGLPTQFRYGQFLPLTEQWTAWTELSEVTYSGKAGFATMAVQSDGALWLLLSTQSQPLLYKRDRDGVWNQPIPWRDSLFFTTGDILDMTSDGNLRLIGASGETYLSAPESDKRSLLSQQVDLADLSRPTLGFMYRFEQAWQETDATLTVSVTNGITATELFQTSPTPSQQEWTLGSADLSLYEGQVITVTFAYEQPADQSWANLVIDNVTLSSYRAPLLLSASPAVIESDWVGEVITVTGQNFTPPLTVSINDVPVIATRLNDTTFTFTMPSTVRVGVQQIGVTNGEGFTIRRGLIRLGHGLFLPLVQRS
jgi:hypothetical protein